MKKLTALFAAIALSFSLPTPASASVSLDAASAQMSLSIGGDGKTLTKTGGPVVFSSGGQAIAASYRIFACSASQTAITTPTQGFLPAVQGAQCTSLYNSDGTFFSGTDLSLAKVQTAQGNTPVYTTPYNISYGAHIVWAAFTIVSANQWSVFPASVQATQPTPPPLSSADASATLSKSGNSYTTALTVTQKMQVLSNPASGMYTVNGIIFGGTQTQLAASVGTTDVLTAAGASPISVTVIRTPNSLASPSQTHVNSQISSLSTPFVSVCWIIDYETQGVHYVCSASVATGNSPTTPGGDSSSAPKYSGPQFSSFGSATLAGNKLVTSGKKLDTITSMKINGAAVTYKINSASELEIDLPKDLAPGKYDVEINSIHGKLTHLQGITIKAVVPTKELAFKAEGAWLNYGSLLELTNIAKQIGSEYTSVQCVVNAAEPAVAERLAKRACSYLEANRLRGKAVAYESKSTYKGTGFWVRVVANG